MNLKRELIAYADVFLNFIYPRNIYCIVCNEAIERHEKYSLCGKCRNKVNFIEGKICIKCGKPLDEEYIPDLCHDCINTDYHFTRALSCIEYNDTAKDIIYALKYHKKRYISYHIAEIMKDRYSEFIRKNVDTIIPVPLHHRKEGERGFNQAYLISKYLGRWLEIHIDNKSLVRTKSTKSQNKLTRPERIKNMKNAFKIVCDKNIRGKKILIIDDIYTTGTTVNEISRELFSKGASDAYVLTFATGKNM